jgi:hypothetical protein
VEAGCVAVAPWGATDMPERMPAVVAPANISIEQGPRIRRIIDKSGI